MRSYAEPRIQMSSSEGGNPSVSMILSAAAWKKDATKHITGYTRSSTIAGKLNDIFVQYATSVWLTPKTRCSRYVLPCQIWLFYGNR